MVCCTQSSQRNAAMKHLLQSTLLAVVGFALTSSLTGCCTLAGLGAGALADSIAPDSLAVAGPDVPRLPRKTPGQLVLNDGSSRDVLFLQGLLEPLSTYREAVALSRNNTLSPVPLPGETVDVVIGSIRHRGYVMSGYEQDGLWLSSDSKRQPFYVSWDRLAALRTVDGVVWTGSELAEACHIDSITTRSGILVRPDLSPAGRLLLDEDRADFIRTSNIDHMMILNRTNNIVWWTIAGIAADLILSAADIRPLKQFGFPTLHP